MATIERIPLPVDDILKPLVEALCGHPSAVVQAPPGAGKSTRVPSALLDAAGVLGLAPHEAVVVLEPRQVAARAVARRIAWERGARLGGEVGYQVRHDRTGGAQTRLWVVTEGILTRRLQDDPLLDGVGVVVLDEFHERSVHTDLALAFLREVQAVRPLKLVVMSATLATEDLAAYLDCPVVRCEGRRFPVHLHYLDKPAEEGVAREAARVVRRFVGSEADDGGSILVFMPGQSEIHQCIEALGEWAGRQGLALLPLYAALPAAEQDRALEPCGQRKIIVATNIAETSLTIEGITTVVDGGQVRQPRFSPATGLDQLETCDISLASAEQRAGRAGRLAPGRAFRLWTRAHEHRMAAFDEPEMARVDVTGPILDVLAWSGAPAERFGWFQAPASHALARGTALLQALGAVEPEGHRLTALGRQMLAIPAHPRLARMLVEGARRGCVDEVAAQAAVLSEGDFALSVDPHGPPVDSDVMLRAGMLLGARPCGHRLEVHRGRMARARQAFDQFARLGRSLDAASVGPRPSAGRSREEEAMLAVATAFADRVAICQDAEARRYVMGGEPLTLGRESLVRDAPMILALVVAGHKAAHGESSGVGRRGLVRMAQSLEPAWVAELFPERRTREVVVGFDAGRERITAVERELWDGYMLNERIVSVEGRADAGEVAALLARETARQMERALGLDAEGVQLVHRLAFARQWLADMTWPWLPALEPEPGEEPVPGEFLKAMCQGKRSFEELRRESLASWLDGHLGFAERRALEEWVPSRLEVPSGSRVRLDYGAGELPVLAVRIQEIFGWTATPRIGRGRVPVKLHLLAPSMRPVQVTQDLESFWRNTYPEVRKELRARYPRHPWPEDPWSAKAHRRK